MKEKIVFKKKVDPKKITEKKLAPKNPAKVTEEKNVVISAGVPSSVQQYILTRCANEDRTPSYMMRKMLEEYISNHPLK